MKKNLTSIQHCLIVRKYTERMKWWNGKRGTGDWLGARPAIEDRGINLTGKWIGTFYGVAAGDLDQRV